MRVEQRRRVWGLLILLIGSGVIVMAVQAHEQAESAIQRVAEASPEEFGQVEPSSVLVRFVDEVKPLYAAKVEWWGPKGEYDPADFQRFVGLLIVGVGLVGAGIACLGLHNVRRRTDRL